MTKAQQEEHVVDALTGECVEDCPCQPAESWPAAPGEVGRDGE